MIEAQPRILMRGVPAEIAARRRRHATRARRRRHAHCGVGIAEHRSGGDGRGILLADGTRIAADVVVAGIGAVPETALAEAAGLAIDNGIAVDADAARPPIPTSLPPATAAPSRIALYGGRRVRLEAWRNAQDQGALAAAQHARRERGRSRPCRGSGRISTTSRCRSPALPTRARRPSRATSATARFILFHLAADGRLVAASGIGPRQAVARDIRLAEMLIAKRARRIPPRSPRRSVKLKSLLAA